MPVCVRDTACDIKNNVCVTLEDRKEDPISRWTNLQIYHIGLNARKETIWKEEKNEDTGKT